MIPFLTTSLAALAGALTLAGCAVAPVEGPYGHGYGYGRPYYYDSGPAYYDAWPGYYYYGPPTIVGRFRFDGGDRDRHWGGGSWRRNSLTLNGDQTRPRAARSPTPRNHAGTRAQANLGPVRRESDKS
jgi:hypothetical protein